MTRSRSPARDRALKRYPVQVRIVVPQEGFGRKLDDMHEWLRLSGYPSDFGMAAWHFCVEGRFMVPCWPDKWPDKYPSYPSNLNLKGLG